MYPVHGAAVAFFQGKFWVFGGSTGDDSYDHTITDKVRGLIMYSSSKLDIRALLEAVCTASRAVRKMCGLYDKFFIIYFSNLIPKRDFCR